MITTVIVQIQCSIIYTSPYSQHQMPLLSLPFAFQLPQLPPTDITAGTDNLCANLVERVALPLTASVLRVHSLVLTIRFQDSPTEGRMACQQIIAIPLHNKTPISYNKAINHLPHSSSRGLFARRLEVMPSLTTLRI